MTVFHISLVTLRDGDLVLNLERKDTGKLPDSEQKSAMIVEGAVEEAVHQLRKAFNHKLIINEHGFAKKIRPGNGTSNGGLWPSQQSLL